MVCINFTQTKARSSSFVSSKGPFLYITSIFAVQLFQVLWIFGSDSSVPLAEKNETSSGCLSRTKIGILFKAFLASSVTVSLKLQSNHFPCQCLEERRRKGDAIFFFHKTVLRCREFKILLINRGSMLLSRRLRHYQPVWEYWQHCGLFGHSDTSGLIVCGLVLVESFFPLGMNCSSNIAKGPFSR